MDWNPPGSSVHGILQARILDWVVIPFSRDSSRPRDWTWIFCIAGKFFTTGQSEKPLSNILALIKESWEILPLLKMKVLVTQSGPTLFDPMDYNPPGSSVHGILQEGILQWVAISFSRESSPPRDQTRVSRIVGRFFTLWATRETLFGSKDTRKRQVHRRKDLY